MADAGSDVTVVDSLEEKHESPLRLRLTLLGLSLLMLAVVLNTTSVSSALPTISHQINSSSVETFWVGTAALICSTTFQPIYGTLANILGRKPVTGAAIAFFAIGTLIASQASNARTLLIARAIQGLGSGGISIVSEVILTDLVPLRQRGKYLACINSVWAVGSTSGPVIGAAFAQEITWRWIFYINLPLVALGFGLMIVFTRLRSVPSSVRGNLRSLDYVGIVLFTGSITSILIPLTWGGTMYAWDSWRTLTPLLIGTVAMVVFGVYERYIATNPVIPLSLFQTWTVIVTYIGTAMHGLILYCGLYYLPFYFQAVKGYTPILSGVALLPVTFTVVPGAMATGIFISRTGKYRGSVWGGWTLLTLGLGIICFLHLHTSNALWIVSLVVIGIGLGMLFSALNLAVLAAACANNPAQAAAAATMFTFFRALGQTLGVALGGTLFSNRVRAGLMSLPAHIQRLSPGTTDAVALVQLIDDISDPASRAEVRTVYLNALRVVLGFMCAVAGASGLGSLIMRQYALSSRVNRDKEVEEARP
ncbi:MFS general substrate transporter [Aspergillus unguis]